MHNLTTSFFATALAMLGLTTGCAPEFEHVSTEVSEVCVRGIPLWFESTQNGTALAQFSFADAGLYMSELEGAAVTLDSMVLMAGPEIGDFAAAESVAVRLVGGRGTPVVALADSPVEPGRSLYVGGDPDTDLAEHLMLEETVEVEVVGQWPMPRWSANADMCFAVEGLDAY